MYTYKYILNISTRYYLNAILQILKQQFMNKIITSKIYEARNQWNNELLPKMVRFLFPKKEEEET